jgi:hypothetical protein
VAGSNKKVFYTAFVGNALISITKSITGAITHSAVI